jgi:hypothetical protein
MSARQHSQRLRVGFARTDYRLGASDRLSAHPKQITGRIGTDGLQGRWPLAAFALAVCRLRVGFARTDCRLGASERLSAHLKENTGRIGTDGLQGRWLHLPLAVCKLRVGFARTDSRSTNAVCEVELELEVAGRISARR